MTLGRSLVTLMDLIRRFSAHQTVPSLILELCRWHLHPVVGITTHGQITGYGDVSGGATHAFVSGPNGGALTDLGTFVGSASWGYTVNDLGQVAGYSQLTDPMGLNTSYRAFLSGGVNDLGTLGSGGSSWGYGVNDLGQVTGMSDLLPGAPFSFPGTLFSARREAAP